MTFDSCFKKIILVSVLKMDYWNGNGLKPVRRELQKS